MALTKRTYVDGETIITAQNLNDIQDEIIAHGTNKVPITRTVNGKALSSNITLNASDVGAVPTTRTVNGNALSSNVTINASDIPNDSAVSGTNIDDALDNLNTALNNINFANATQVSTSGQDLNNYTSGGVWFFLYASNPSNRPSSANQYGFLAVFNGGNADRITQIWIDTAPAKNNVYIRSRNSTDGWCAWHALYNNNAIFKTKNLLLIGDSYNDGNGGTSGRGWGYYLQQFTGCSATIVHQNGGGFAVAGNSNASYPNKKYSELVSSLPSAIYDYVIVQSGWNDASPTANTGGASEISSGIDAFVTAIRAKYPTADIIILPCYNDTYPLNTQQYRLLTIAKTAVKNNVRTCFDSFLWMQNSGYNASDNIHLNDNGYQLLAKYIYAFLNGWDGTISFQKEITSAVTKPSVSGVTLGSNFRVYVTKDFCYASGDITLTGTLTNWATIVTGCPKPQYSQIDTLFQWTSDFKRPMRAEGYNGNLNIRYGEAGNYRFNMCYPINLLTET